MEEKWESPQFVEAPEPIVALHAFGDKLYAFTKHGVYAIPQVPPKLPMALSLKWKIKRWVLIRLDRLSQWIEWNW